MDFDDKGIAGTRAIIEQKILELGGKVRVESLVDFAQRLKRDIENKEYLSRYPDTFEAVSDSRKYVRDLFSQLERGLGLIHESNIGIRVEVEKKVRDCFTMSSDDVFMRFNWHQPISNSIDKAKLQVRCFRNEGVYGLHNFNVLCESTFVFSINSIRERGWYDDRMKFWQNRDLADHLLKQFLDKMREYKEY